MASFFSSGNSEVDAAAGQALGGFFSKQLDRMLPANSATATSRTAQSAPAIAGNPTAPVSTVPGQRPRFFNVLKTPAGIIGLVLVAGALAWFALRRKRK